MHLTNAAETLLAFLITMVGAVMVAEFVGYCLHRMLHSDRFPVLSRAHLIHHFLLYGPNQPMRAAEYKNGTDGHVSIGNVGWEWLLPSGAVLFLCWGAMWLLRVAWPYQLLALATMVVWPVFMFSYLHDRMHLKNFWMERTPLLRIWFLKARRLHDIHHHVLNNQGRMDRNFGIGFFLFDRIFRTFARKHCPFNWHGYRAAAKRYKLERSNQEDFSHSPSGYHI
jgi:sterol desaturase/sphingolipid hydroxylase (fatty acid hydroxylase superfamily)